MEFFFKYQKTHRLGRRKSERKSGEEILGKNWWIIPVLTLSFPGHLCTFVITPMLFTGGKWLTRMTEVLSWASANQWVKMAQDIQVLQTLAEGLVPLGQCLELKDRGCSPGMKAYFEVTSSGKEITIYRNLYTMFNVVLHLWRGQRKAVKALQGICLNNNNRNVGHYYPLYRSTKNKHGPKSSS